MEAVKWSKLHDYCEWVLSSNVAHHCDGMWIASLKISSTLQTHCTRSACSPLKETLERRIRMQWSLQQKCGTGSGHTAVEALCTSLVCLLFVCVLSCHTLFTCHRCYVRGDMLSISMLVGVHYGCSVTCDIMLHWVMSHVMSWCFLSQVMSHCACHSHYNACHYYVHITAHHSSVYSVV